MSSFEEYCRRIPHMIHSELENVLYPIDSYIADLEKRKGDIVSGKTKEEMCQWWLTYVETEVRSHLSFSHILLTLESLGG
jgi:hypothetical protein